MFLGFPVFRSVPVFRGVPVLLVLVHALPRLCKEENAVTSASVLIFQDMHIFLLLEYRGEPLQSSE